jgi:hypothetical protein
MKRIFLFLAILGLGLPLAALAEKYYFCNIAMPSTYPQWSANMTNNTSNDKFVGGTMATNAVPAKTTNTAILATAIDLYWPWSTVSVQATGNAITNAVSTNYLFLYPTDDLVNADTNNAIVIGPFTNQGTSNFCNISNITALVKGQYGGHRGYFAGFGTTSTNTVTNLLVQFFVASPFTYVASP